MKFSYQYRTRDNVLHSGIVCASTRDDAFARLKAQGIRPAQLVESPGVFNKLIGKGKRWMLIAALVLVAIVLSLKLLRKQAEQEEIGLRECRSQIYGDPAVVRSILEDGKVVFPESRVAQVLSRYAIPGRAVDPRDDDVELMRLEYRPGVVIGIVADDFDEVSKLKRIVNGMCAELDRYVEHGGTPEKYLQRLRVRQQAEVSLVQHTRDELFKSKSVDEWREKNAKLRSMGLPMIDPDDI